MWISRLTRLRTSVALAALLGCSGSSSESPLRNSFGTLNFTFESRPARDQIELVDRFGYEGIAMFWPGVDEFHDFVDLEPVVSGRVRILAVLLELHVDSPPDSAAVDAILDALAPTGTDLWIIVSGSAGSEAIAAVVRDLVDRAGERSVRVVLYPHEGFPVATAEQALALRDLVGRDALKISIHLCHELKAGNVDRLGDVIDAVAPHLVLATINGADREDTPGWSTTIQPLDRGDLDVAHVYLEPLVRAGYDGPVVLHTFGLVDPPEEHLARSMRAWRRMANR